MLIRPVTNWFCGHTNPYILPKMSNRRTHNTSFYGSNSMVTTDWVSHTHTQTHPNRSKSASFNNGTLVMLSSDFNLLLAFLLSLSFLLSYRSAFNAIVCVFVCICVCCVYTHCVKFCVCQFYTISFSLFILEMVVMVICNAVHSFFLQWMWLNLTDTIRPVS